MLRAVAFVALFINVTASGKGDCSSTQKDRHQIIYCESHMCDGCCDPWCRDMCDKKKEDMEQDGCSCDSDPEAHNDEAFCKKKNKQFKEDHKDDTFEMQQGRACALGCKQCCIDNQNFLQVSDSVRHQCQTCMQSKGL
eukprot:gnl/TRDRNA2_/TRDRNA2_198368_c0_seq1.p1 gnl/TRDRNA2_/TRDRNA2_198368_c0~~gnl/TRDRNA2_/TRDRNA2_198368_c0_seq1.p1  ORF type:complete len:138 (-),score=32.63 gnl/TRDRNA2_/TRDRNA2_198368_c0_seq1:52-465(-)